VGELGAAAALTGLVFVGISINLNKIMASPYLPNDALEALTALVAVLFITSLAWQSQQRRLSQDYERLCATGEAWIYLTVIRLMVRRLARF
jgi:modulator of FtsH protease